MSAVISSCGNYRYVLKRSLDSIVRWHQPMLFIMLNPSIADETIDDPTIRRCVNFAKREGATALTVVNLFALRATDPAELSGHPDPVGPDNDKHVLYEIEQHKLMPIVAAWGAHKLTKDRALWLSMNIGVDLHCLGKTKDGSPRHPLYVKSDQPLVVL